MVKNGMLSGQPSRIELLKPTEVAAQRDLQALPAMHLVGQLSNPAPRLQSILCLSRSGVKRKAQHSQVLLPAPRRLGNGVVQRAIIRVLMAADEPMRTGEVQAGVERVLGHPVAKESVSWSLRSGSRGEEPRFEQVTYATYRLADKQGNDSESRC